LLTQKDKFKLTEKYLYDYKKNLAELDSLREDYTAEKNGSDVHAQNYEASLNTTGEPSNPPHEWVVKIEGMKTRIKKLDRYTKPITRLLNDLSAPENLRNSDYAMLLEILKLMYLGKNKPKDIYNELAISKTSFFRKRRELVYLAREYIGL